MLRHIYILFASFVILESAKILVVVPTPSISHQLVFRSLIQELINRNHEIIVITTDPAYNRGESPKNLKEIDLHNLSYKIWDKVYNANALGKTYQDDHLSVMKLTYQVAYEIFQGQLLDKSVVNLMRNKTIKFDLLILEELILSNLIFSYIFEAPVIQMSSFGDCRGSRNIIGALTHPLLYPIHLHQRIYNLTIWEKISELYNHMAFERFFKNLDYYYDIVLQNVLGNTTPTMNKLKNNVHMLFLSVNPIWIHNQPVPSSVIYSWGIHKTEKKLPKDLQDYLDSSQYGAIYISFGTNFKTSLMDPNTLKILLTVFSRLPYNILWKWDTDVLAGKSENIKISKWFPQYDVLRHPNLKLFITQGGLQSTDEAISAGVPLIGFPLLGDQKYNTEKYVHFKIGIQLNKKSLTIEKLENAIHTILSDYDNYRKNVINLRTLMHDQPKPPLQNAIWWIEYVLRHGGARHLRAPAANMPWTEYYEIELVLILFSGLIVITTVILFILYSCFKK